MKTHCILLAVFFASAAITASAENPTVSRDEATIRTNVQAAVDAFNHHDAKSLAALWSPEAIYTSRASGEQVVGREAIEKEYDALFKSKKGRKLAVSIDSIDFASPNVAIERGTAKISGGDDPVEDTEYSAVHIKRDGKWLLDRLTEDDVPAVQSHHDQLKELDWMVGSWVDDDKEDNAEIVTECQWTKNHNFMTRAFKVTIGDRITMSGMQIIGWDPAAKKIRSWVFDSDGGYAEGVWQRKGNRWYIKQTGVLPDGGRSSEVNVLTKVDDDTFTWQSTNREIDGEIQPNIDEIKVVRDQKP